MWIVCGVIWRKLLQRDIVYFESDTTCKIEKGTAGPLFCLLSFLLKSSVGDKNTQHQQKQIHRNHFILLEFCMFHGGKYHNET